jgi:hypothetical protein
MTQRSSTSPSHLGVAPDILNNELFKSLGIEGTTDLNDVIEARRN